MKRKDYELANYIRKYCDEELLNLVETGIEARFSAHLNIEDKSYKRRLMVSSFSVVDELIEKSYLARIIYVALVSQSITNSSWISFLWVLMTASVTRSIVLVLELLKSSTISKSENNRNNHIYHISRILPAEYSANLVDYHRRLEQTYSKKIIVYIFVLRHFLLILIPSLCLSLRSQMRKWIG